MNKDGYIGLGLGIIFLVAARFPPKIRPRHSPPDTPYQALTKAERIVLLVFGVIFMAYGIGELVAR